MKFLPGTFFVSRRCMLHLLRQSVVPDESARSHPISYFTTQIIESEQRMGYEAVEQDGQRNEMVKLHGKLLRDVQIVRQAASGSNHLLPKAEQYIYDHSAWPYTCLQLVDVSGRFSGTYGEYLFSFKLIFQSNLFFIFFFHIG